MAKICVLGCGLVGRAIVSDLLKEHEIIVSDINAEALQEFVGYSNVRTEVFDLSRSENILPLIEEVDLVIGAMPGNMGYQCIKTVINASKNIVDISFFPENPFDLDNLAKEKGVTAVMDCGVAPGMGNIILGYHATQMKVDSMKCYVGGLPFIRNWPWEYKAVFSPIDVIEEYTRPARYVENGKIITKEALSDAELIHFDSIGSLEAWNSDGLRTLIDTMKVPNMIEKTLRYPGTIEYLKVLRDSGFFSYDEMEVKGKTIRPIDLTAKLLFPKWELKQGEEDFTVMRIILEGYDSMEEKNLRFTYELFDRYDEESQIHSMARTTAYTCTAVAHEIIQKRFINPGINPPEYIGQYEDSFQSILNYLSKRKVIYNLKREEID